MRTNFSVQDLELKGVKLITPFYMEDDRGFFLKSFERDIFEEWGLDAEIQEAFESYSHKNVIRGLHFQTKSPQIKIVRVIKGIIRDVVVDIRKDSPTFGEHISVVLTDENHNILWIPQGFAHGFEVLSEEAIVSYKCVGKYWKGSDTGILWNDKDLGIVWETVNPILSKRDEELMSFKEFVEKYQGL